MTTYQALRNLAEYEAEINLYVLECQSCGQVWIEDSASKCATAAEQNGWTVVNGLPLCADSHKEV